MPENESFLAVARALKGVRTLAELCSNPLLLNLIDMALLEACEAVRPEGESSRPWKTTQTVSEPDPELQRT